MCARERERERENTFGFVAEMYSKLRLVELDNKNIRSKSRIKCNKLKHNPAKVFSDNYQSNHAKQSQSPNQNGSLVTFMRFIFISVLVAQLVLIQVKIPLIGANVLMRVCDTREIKTVTSRVCMLYKRTKNSDIKMDKQGNIRIARSSKGDYSPAKLASECCKVGCPPHIFAYNC